MSEKKKGKRKTYLIYPENEDYLKRKNYNNSEGINQLIRFAIEQKEKGISKEEDLMRINKKLQILDIKVSELYDFFLE